MAQVVSRPCQAGELVSLVMEKKIQSEKRIYVREHKYYRQAKQDWKIRPCGRGSGTILKTSSER